MRSLVENFLHLVADSAASYISSMLCMCCMCRGRCEQNGGRMEIIASANPPLE